MLHRLTLGVVCVLCVSAPALAEPPKPNVLWLCGDDHAAYVCGAYGNSQVRTPNLDRLAKGGMRFDRAYCNSPVCTASRQSFLTGRYPQTIGVTLLQTPLPESETTLAERLKAAGYDTAAIGKMHFNSTLKHGFDVRLDLPDYRRWLERKGKEPLPANIETLGVWRPFKDPASVWLNSRCLPFAAMDADMADTWFAQEAVKYVKGPRSERPFFLMCSFTAPHSPFHFAVEFRGRHDAGRFKAPDLQPQDRGQVPAIFRDLTAAEKQGIAAAYCTSAEFLDKNVGLVLNALEKTGLAKDTLVIYTGDHGYMLGQHGRFEKHCFYEPAVRAPLLIRGPRVEQERSSEALVEFIDIAPTILHACGFGLEKELQGKSLVPLLEGKTHTHRDRVFSIYCENEEAMVRDLQYKLIYCTGNRVRQDGYVTEPPLKGRRVQLFDVQSDPGELRNLADDPAHAKIRAERLRQLAEHLRTTVRHPERVPKSDDPFVVLDYCLQPRDGEK